MFNTKAFENSRPDGFPVLEIVSEETAPTGERAFVPLKHTRLTGNVAGPLADLKLTQTFGYGREQSDKVLEAVYRFPLPGDAAVTGVVVRFGEVEIVAQLKERQQAETDYQQAKNMGRQAALTTRESPDVFTLRVAGLQPEQDVTVETSYVQLARAEGREWTLRVPLTTSPRYVRADESGSRHAQGQPLAVLRDPGHRFGMDVKFEQAGEVRSATHALDVQDLGGNLKQARLQNGDVLPDRDCVLSWQAVQEAARPGLSVLLHDDKASGYTYFLALVAPMKAAPANDSVAREAILLVDHSGSMEGAKWEAADWAVKQFLGNLTAKDSFALGLFHSTTKWFSHGGLYATSPHAANPGVVAKAVKYLDGNKDSGGTELGVALEQALGLHRNGEDRARHVLIVTDAEVTDAERIFLLADQEAATPHRRRISVLCIDAAPNAFLASELAERGGGVAKFLTSAPDEEDITTALDAVLEDFAQPILANLKLEINRAGAEASGRNVLPGRNAGSSALDLGDMPRGRAIWIAGRVKRGDDSSELAFTVTVSGREVASLEMDGAQTESNRPAIKALFGARRVLALEYLANGHYYEALLHAQLKRLGYDPKILLAASQSNTVYAENATREPQEILKNLLVKEALDYGLACSETAFVAVRTEAGKPIEGTAVVANALPSGWSGEFAGAPPPPGAMPHMLFGAASAYTAAPAAPAPTMSRMRLAKSAAPPSPPASSSGGSGLSGVIGGLFGGKKADKAKQAPSVRATEDREMGMDMLAESVAAPSDVDDVDLRTRAMSLPASEPTPAPARSTPTVVSGQALFAGVPTFASGEAVLFDTARTEDAAKLPASAIFSLLEVRMANSKMDPNLLPGDVMLLLFVDDLAQPRARVRLSDLLRQGGSRPLNVRRNAGQTVRITLVDSSGSAPTLPTMEVALRW